MRPRARARHHHVCLVDRLETRSLLSYGFGSPHDGVLNVTFLGDHYPLTSEGTARYLADIEVCKNALQSVEPFRSRSEQFAFQSLPLGPSLGISFIGSANPRADYPTVNQVVVDSGVTTDVAVVLVNHIVVGGSGEHQIPVICNASPDALGPVFLHEMGHTLGIEGNPALDAYNLLLDEYVYGGLAERPFDNQPHQNIYAGDPALGTPPEWADLVAPDEYFRGATYPNWYRTSPLSVMRSETSPYLFNSVSLNLLRQGIDYWAGPINDPTAPQVAFAGLHDGDTVSGVVQVATTATDNRAVVSTQLWVDGHLARNATAAPFTLTWLTGATAPGSHVIQVKAFDAAGNVGLSPAIQVTLVNPSNLAFTSPLPGSLIGATPDIGVFTATVNGWADAINEVRVWIDNDLSHVVARAAAPYTFSISTSGLTPGAHVLTAVAINNNDFTESARTTVPFTFEPLSVSILAPSASATVAGIVPVTIDVGQGHPDRIELTYANRSGTSTTLTRTGAPWTFAWDSETAFNGTVGLFVTAYEGTGIVYLPVHIVQVRNGFGTLVTPEPGAVLSGTTTVTYNGSTNVDQVVLQVDGATVDTAHHGGYVDFSWDTRSVANGGHTVTIVASNIYGWSRASSVSVTVSNALGTLRLASPGAGSTVKGLVPITIEAVDGAVLRRIDVSIDGQVMGAVTSAPFTWTWDTRGLADGGHAVNVVATRTSGATETFSTSVLVDNLFARFASPAAGAIVKGKVALSLTGTLGSPTAVIYGVDSNVLAGTITPPSFAYAWNTVGMPDGFHVIWAVLVSAQGGTDLLVQTVQVRNDQVAPVVTLISPAANARVGASLLVTGRATDAGGVALVQLYLDDKLVASAAPSGATFNLAANLTNIKKGTHRIRVLAIDRSGNAGWSAYRTIQRV